jgi:sensor histidine kinase regulating citrate/malate metabolism
MEFQFYSQTLQLRDINDSVLLIKMLQYILKSSDEILLLNEEIHRIISSRKFLEISVTDSRLAVLRAYAEKSRVIEHNFGNILQILTKVGSSG